MTMETHSFQGSAEWRYLPGSHRNESVRVWKTPGRIVRVRNSFRANGVPEELTVDTDASGESVPYGVRQWWLSWANGVWTLAR
jgi:hypothetical protein